MDDRELVRCAQNGDAAALGVLLARHEAGMRAVALSVLGHGPDAEDAVQDAMVTAVRRIGDVRDPAAAGAWLRAAVRNHCRMRLRSRPALPVADPEWFLPHAGGPDELIERAALRDWVWHAIGELSEGDRLVTMLRHFSSVTSYEQIALVCGLPIGTVRSRLSHAHRKLTGLLRAGAEQAYPDSGAYTRARRREASDALSAAMRGDFRDVVDELWWPDADMTVPASGQGGGREFAVRGMECDLASGVRQRLVSVVAGQDVLIWETELIGGHCPPGAVWLQRMEQGRVRSLTLCHARTTSA
ncbi:DNA-directed RNA polymerase sigma-70 factor [Actinoplanes cyaneus]|uniref:DNA-directed RNA polymerase sigma-70 factor n=1 Tax=Actinoplanes cyaneus TaxID=52696 RepID=A0A919IQE2_9ACTN|nr:sigma-70 family RNA polymerase sigma factor [Actinoplanes cyaneus]MCW2143007.1 RNA polymerase sigma-70 factor, ECF subfamily [Actinoplanes cyaneus]GID69558.1 DNA-directed RNA polymerase sigma-70 factor [Actinoplanes cyaneus]